MTRVRLGFYITRLADLEPANDHSLIEVVTLKFCAADTSQTGWYFSIHIVMAFQ